MERQKGDAYQDLWCAAERADEKGEAQTAAQLRLRAIVLLDASENKRTIDMGACARNLWKQARELSSLVSPELLEEAAAEIPISGAGKMEPLPTLSQYAGCPGLLPFAALLNSTYLLPQVAKPAVSTPSGNEGMHTPSSAVSAAAPNTLPSCCGSVTPCALPAHSETAAPAAAAAARSFHGQQRQPTQQTETANAPSASFMSAAQRMQNDQHAKMAGRGSNGLAACSI